MTRNENTSVMSSSSDWYSLLPHVNNESHISLKDIKYMHQRVFIRSNIMEKHLIYQDDLNRISIAFHLNEGGLYWAVE